jgi:signal transduction histidine kinase
MQVSIKRKLIIRIILASGLITTLITAISFYIDYKSELNLLEKSLHQVESSLLDTVSYAVWELDQDQVKRLFTGILTNNNFYSVVYINNKGELDYSQKNNVSKPQYISKKEYPLKVVVADKNTTIGKIVITYFKDDIFTKLFSRVLFVFFTQGIKTLIITMIMFFLFSKFVTKYIEQIISFLANYDLSKDYNFEVLVLKNKSKDKKKDELDTLVKSINDMLIHVSKQNSENLEVIKKKESEVEDQKILAINASKLASLGEMAGRIAHEINNPMMIISSSARAIGKEVKFDEMDKNKILDRLNKINYTVERVTKIINSVKSFSRNADHDLFETVPVYEVIEDSLSLCMEKFRHEKIDIRFKGIDKKTTVEVRKSEISQILINLLNNSFDALMELEDRWIEISVDVKTDFVRVCITDSGHGVDKECETKIFSPFFTTKEVGKGTGLGLGISQKLATVNGGKLTLDKECENTKFSLYLPIKHPENLEKTLILK